jgi:hypothetical protein
MRLGTIYYPGKVQNRRADSVLNFGYTRHFQCIRTGT